MVSVVPALGCSTIFGVDVANIVKQTVNGNGVVTAATIDTATLQKILNGQIQPGGSSVAVSSASRSATTVATSKTRTRGNKFAASTLNTNAVGGTATTQTSQAGGTTATSAASGTATNVKGMKIAGTKVVTGSAVESSVVATSTIATSTAASATRRPTQNAEKNKFANNVFNSTLKARNIWA